MSTAVSLALDNTVQVFGSRGSIHVALPWGGSRPDGSWRFELAHRGERETFSGTAKPLYVLEVDAVADALAAGAVQSAAMTWDDSLGNAATLDRWRQAAGVEFDFEQPERQTMPVHGRALTVRRKTMRYGHVRDIEKPVSRLVMGCDNQPNMAHAAAMFDNYFEYGGNAFDTAHIYGGGRMERLLGTWMRNRGCARAGGGDRQGRAYAGQFSRSRRPATGHLSGTPANRPCGSVLPAPGTIRTFPLTNGSRC